MCFASDKQVWLYLKASSKSCWSVGLHNVKCLRPRAADQEPNQPFWFAASPLKQNQTERKALGY